MAAINPPAEWSTDQALLPETEVDLFELSGDLTTGIPRSTEGAVEADPAEPVETKSKTSRAKK